MPTKDVTYIDQTLLALSLLKGSGGVGRWRSVTGRALLKECIATAPVNDPLNAAHRGFKVGTYKESFYLDNENDPGGFLFKATVGNTASHAVFVENGRSGSNKRQVFSWARAFYRRAPRREDGWVKIKPGTIMVWSKTGGRPGQHIMEDAGIAVAARRKAVFSYSVPIMYR